jgi:hypothetical protein
MALMSLAVVRDGGERVVVPVTPKVVVAAERQFHKSMASLFGEDSSMEVLAWVAWKASHFAGQVVKPFDEWLDDIEMIEAVDEGRAPFETR